MDELIEACQTQSQISGFAATLSPVKDFFDRYGADEACAMCLLACLQHTSDPPLLEKLAQWAQDLGGKPTLDEGAQAGAGPQQGGTVKHEKTVRHSGRYGGVCRAIGRLLVRAAKPESAFTHSHIPYQSAPQQSVRRTRS